LLDVLLDEGVDALAAMPAVANLDEVTMIAKMNARPLSGNIVVDVEDFGNAWCNALGRLFANPCTQEWRRQTRDHQWEKKTPW
jgi:hypothetical protein